MVGQWVDIGQEEILPAKAVSYIGTDLPGI
jgi:hypothetical protein